MALKSIIANTNFVKSVFQPGYILSQKVQIGLKSQYSTSKNSQPGKVVFISQSTNIYENLALEDWLYQNWDFSKKYILLLWRNSPSVVIGRHQNPYVEANLNYLDTAEIPCVRRNSGGGTVYHDFGNLNCSFFTPKERHNRLWNLNLICKALKKDFDLNCEVNTKHDIVTDTGAKVSGTAAKLGRLTAYHHCTLLVSADKLQLKLTLQGDKSIKSKATESVPSPIANLQDMCPTITVEKLLGSIGKTFLESSLPSHEEENPVDNYRQSDGFTLINPTEDWFPGIESLKHKLTSWDWFYGMTPMFEITRPIALQQDLYEGSSVLVTVKTYHGLIKEVELKTRVSPSLKDLLENHIGNALKGTRFTSDTFADIETRLLVEKELKPHYSSL